MPGKHNGRKRARGEGDDLPPPGRTTCQTQLNNSVQKILKRNLLHREIVYEVQEVEGGVQATVTIPELSDTYSQKTFSGEVHDEAHAARESVATICLETILAEPELLAIHDEPRPFREPGERPPDDAPRHKSRLRNTILKICRISLQKDHITFETLPSGDGFISTVICSCLPGEWAEKSWTGEVCEDENLAEQSAALVAVEEITADSELMELHDRPKPDDGRSKGKGKGKDKGYGKGKGKSTGNFDWSAIDPMTMMFCFQNGVNPMTMMQNMGKGGKGYGNGWEPPPFKRPRTEGQRGQSVHNTQLNNVCQKVIKRGLQKGEIEYDCVAVEGGYQTKVTCKCLPDKWSVTVFAGEVETFEKAANESAAAIAVQAILADPELKALYDIPKPEREPRPEAIEDSALSG